MEHLRNKKFKNLFNLGSTELPMKMSGNKNFDWFLDSKV